MSLILSLLSGVWSGLASFAKLILGSKLAMAIIGALLALFLLFHALGSAEKRGFEAGLLKARTECNSAALRAELSMVKAAAKADRDALDKARDDAAKAKKTYWENEAIANSAIAKARAMLGAKDVCLTKDVTDELRRLH